MTDSNNVFPTQLTAIAETAAYLLFELRRDRKSHPQGRFDSKGRWYPSDAENGDSYTFDICSPSKAYPYSYLVAARTRKHLLALARISPHYVVQQAIAAGVSETFKPSYDAYLVQEAALAAKAVRHAAKNERRRIAYAIRREREILEDFESSVLPAFRDAA